MTLDDRTLAFLAEIEDIHRRMMGPLPRIEIRKREKALKEDLREFRGYLKKLGIEEISPEVIQTLICVIVHLRHIGKAAERVDDVETEDVVARLVGSFSPLISGLAKDLLRPDLRSVEEVE